MSFGDTFKALSDPTRREILNLLKQGSMTAGQIVEHFDTTGATISHHLNILRQAGLIEDRKSGKYSYYELNTTVFQEVLSWMHSLMEEDKHEKDTCIDFDPGLEPGGPYRLRIQDGNAC